MTTTTTQKIHLTRKGLLNLLLALLIGICTIISLTCGYLFLAWRYPGTLVGPDGILNQYTRQISVAEEKDVLHLKRKGSVAAIVLRRTEAGWHAESMNWRDTSWPPPDPAYPLHYVHDGNLVYIHTESFRKRVITIYPDDRVRYGEFFQDVPLFGVIGRVRTPRTLQSDFEMVNGTGPEIYVAKEAANRFFVVDAQYKLGPYEEVYGIPGSGSDPATSPIFLARQHGQRVLVMGTTHVPIP